MEMNPPRFILRAALQEDYATIRRMVNQAHLFPFSLDWRHFVLAVREDGGIAGCIQVKSHSDGTREMASLVVSPSQRGQGIARMLIQAVQAGQPRPLYLTCRGALQPLYAKFGFRALDAPALPPYYRRLRRVFEVARFLLRFKEELAVMVWDS